MQKGGNGDGVSHIDAPDDPDVAAITERLNDTGDTLGAIGELQQLIIERTGHIPVISPELLAAHAARIDQTGDEHPAAASEPIPEARPEPEQESVALDWSIAAPEALDPAPGFSAWVDPEAIAAAIDTTPRVLTDVSTKVFAVFSAERADAEPAVAVPETPVEPPAEPAPAPEPEAVADSEATPEPEPAPEPESAHTPAPAVAEPAAAAKRRWWPFGRR